MGITLDTSKFGLSEETRCGVWLSLGGIPYFKLRRNKYASRLNLTDDFVRFVVDCDDVRLNTSRSDFAYDETYDAMESALDEVFEKIRSDARFQEFYTIGERSSESKARSS